MRSDVRDLPLAALTTSTVLELVRELVRAELAELRSDPAPVLLDRDGLAKALCCSTGQVDKLRKQGLPTRRIGDSPRFILAEVIAWLPSDDKTT